MSALSSATRTRGRTRAARCLAGGERRRSRRTRRRVRLVPRSPSGIHRSASSTKAPAPDGRRGARRAARRCRSAGRCARPSGIGDREGGALAGVLSTPTVPPCRRTSSCTSARPMPGALVRAARAPSTRWKRSNTCGSSFGGMPTPVSRDVSSTRVAVASRARPRSRPANVNLNAFESEVEDDLLPHVRDRRRPARAAARSRRRAQPRAARRPTGRRSRDRP